MPPTEPRESPPPKALPSIGEGYTLTAKLGEGAFGEVYKARHELLGQEFAVKLLRPELCEDQDVRARFLDEARALIRFSHPNIVQVRHVGEHDGRLFLVMDLVTGTELSTMMRSSGAFEEERALDLIKQILSGLDAAHAAGIVHRDLKPSNILIETSESGRERVKILDFGLSKFSAIDGEQGAHRSITGTIVGTLAYMSPEQIKGDRDIDGRSDLFAAGLIFLEMLQGHHPYPGESGIVVAAKLLRDPIPPIEEARASQISVTTRSALSRALERDRDARFPSVTAFAQALEGRGPPSDTSRVTTIAEAQADLARREAEARKKDAAAGGKKRSLVPLVLVLVLLGGGAAAYFGLGLGKDEGQPARGGGDGRTRIARGGGEEPDTPPKTPAGAADPAGGAAADPSGTATDPSGDTPVPGTTEPGPADTPDPSGGTDEPDRPDPAAGTAEPDTPTPSAGTPDAAGAATDPSAAGRDPAGTTTEPAPGATDPSAGAGFPDPKTPDPAAGTPDPAAGAQDPAGGADVPAGGTEEPGPTPGTLDPRKCCGKAAALFDAGDWPAARKIFVQAAAASELTADTQVAALRGAAESYMAEADVLARSGRLEQSLALLGEAIEWVARRHEAYEQVPRAVETARLQLGFSRMHIAEAHVERARWLLVGGDKERAAVELKQAEVQYDFALQHLQRDGVRYWEFLIRRAQMYRLQGNAEEMIKDVAHTTKTNNHEVPAHMWVAHATAARHLAQAWQARGGRSEALQWAQKASKVAEDGVGWQDVNLTRQQWLDMARVLFVDGTLMPPSEDPTALHGKMRYWVGEAAKKKPAAWLHADVAEARLITGRAMERYLQGRVLRFRKQDAEADQVLDEALGLLDQAVALQRAVAGAGGLQMEGLPLEVQAAVLEALGRAQEAKTASEGARRAELANPD